MKTVPLPDTLQAGPGLESLNRELRAGSIQLDWSAVGQVSDEALAVLLDGITLNDMRVLGLNTVRPGLEMRVLHRLMNISVPAVKGVESGGGHVTGGRVPETEQPARKGPAHTPREKRHDGGGEPETEHRAQNAPAYGEVQTADDVDGGDGLEQSNQGEVANGEKPEAGSVMDMAQASSADGAQGQGARPDGLPDLPQSAAADADASARDGELREKTGAKASPARRGGESSSASARILEVPSAMELRRELQALVLDDLLGPAGGPEEEVDERRIRDRYLVGALVPRRYSDTGEDDDSLAVAGADGPEDEPEEPDPAGPETMRPSSIGLSFFVNPAATGLRVAARWGRYERVHSESLTNEKGGPKMVWKRVPVEGVLDRLPLEPGEVERWEPNPDQPDVFLRGSIRQRDSGWVVTLFLVNGQREPAQLKDTVWLFQPELVVEDADGGAIFCSRPPSFHSGSDRAGYEEERAMAMLYRRRREFVAGHGVAVHADQSDGVYDRAYRLSTRVAPAFQVPVTDSPDEEEVPELARMSLDMMVLAEMEPAALSGTLSLLVTGYRRWIEEQEERIGDPAAQLEGFEEEARGAVAQCRRACERIEAGIALLLEDGKAADAFRFMNRAMWQQRIHSVYAEAVRRHDDATMETIDVPWNRSWRPFQLAFILMNLPGITDLHHPERSTEADATADLLWFPTGGGKTEAYLGLTAYTIAIRRLQGIVSGHSGEYGVAVLMRYTLRLLTLQQFQRAATLLCACELIRQEAWFDGDPRWGSQPFRIGLWVGQKTTPNTTEQSHEAVKLDRGHWHGGSSVSGSGSPAQLTNCPWCGTRIDPGRDIVVDKVESGRGRTLIYCGDGMGRCPFSQKQAEGEGLPILVVDEEIYRHLPSLLIGTVDKFAQMPWKGETQMLFGQVDSRCERHGFRSPEINDKDSHPSRVTLPAARTVNTLPARPPDLIIQDELHLISGPLGTLVGLYETAIDYLSTWEVEGRTVRPKVIASTATIRRASEQIHGLFLRSVNIFPPHGLDIEDNFFSRQRPPGEEHPGRLYLGICAQGLRLKKALIQVYVAYLAAAKVLYDKYGRAADPWMTLVGYFNSMRELGGMRRLVDDDIRSRLRHTGEHGLANRWPPLVEELTSRKGSTEIPAVLERLERVFDPEEEKARKSRNDRGVKGIPRPIDVLLATNMLSVGVDVQRLGLMVVGGQPKTTAEYIQATSRVGRRHPGVVCVVFNWVRPRDLSHYERFEHYHDTFYQQVEALSVTPFAPRARDRALSALLIALVRLQEHAFNGNGGAGKIAREHPLVEQAIETIARRAWQVTGDEGVRDTVRAELEDRLEHWVSQARRDEGGRVLGYEGRHDSNTVPLLVKPGSDPWSLFTCLTSLRDVEPEVNLILDDRALDGDPVRRGPEAEEPITPVPDGIGSEGGAR